MEHEDERGSDSGSVDRPNDVSPDVDGDPRPQPRIRANCNLLQIIRPCTSHTIKPLGIFTANSLLTLPPFYLLQYTHRVREFSRTSPKGIHYFLDGKDFFMNLIWPTALIGGFLLSDLIRFAAYPSWRYHNTITDIFLGTSPNQNEVFGTQMGSDLPNEASYWPGFALLIVLPFAFGLTNYFTRNNTRLDSSRAVLGLHRMRGDPGEQAGLIAHQGGLDEHAQEEDALSRSGFGKLLLSLHSEHHQFMNGEVSFKGNVRKYVFFSIYELLKLGFLLATRYRYYRFLVNKIIGFAYYLHEKYLCEQEHRTYQYFPRTQENECEICPDWLSVYDPRNPQNCIDGLFRIASGPDELSVKIPVVTAQTQSLDEIDLTGYQWTGWTEYQMSNVTQRLSVLSSIQLLNASRPDQNVLFPHDSKIQSLSTLIKGSCVRVIDFTNQGIGDLSQSIFFAFNNNSCINGVYLPGNAITDQGLRQFSDVANNAQIRSLSFANNQVTDEGITYMTDHVSHSTLVEIDFSQNYIFQTGLTTFGRFLSNNQNLRTVKLSNMVFSGFDFTQFGQGLRNSGVSTLQLSKCGLGDYEISTLTQYCDHVTVLDLSNNFQLTTQGVPLIVDNLSRSTVTTLLLSGTPIDDDALIDLGVGLNRTMISTLNLSSNQFTNQAFIQFLSVGNNSRLSCIIASNNNFGDNDMRIISNILSTYKSVTCVDFSSNNFTDDVGAALIQSLRGKQTRSINLANNKIGDQTASELAKLISEGFLEHLDISRNHVSSFGIGLIGATIPGSRMTHLIIANNLQTNSAGLLGIVENFVSDFPNRELISKTSPPRDVLRWVNQDAVSVTNLTHFDASGTNATQDVTNALCVVEAKTNLKPKNINMDNNPLLPSSISCVKRQSVVKSSQCRHSFLASPGFQSSQGRFVPSGSITGGSSQHSTPFNSNYLLGFAVPVFGFFVLAIVLYKVLAPYWRSSSSEMKDDENHDRDENSFNFG